MAIIKPPTIPIPPDTGQPGPLGTKIENILKRYFGWLFNRYSEGLGHVIRFGADTFLEGIEPYLIRAYSPLLSNVKAAEGCPPELQNLIDMALSGESQAGAALLGIVGSGLGGGLFGSIGSAVFGGWTRYANSKARQLRPDIAMAQAMLRRGSISEDQYRLNLAEIGWSEQAASAIWQITQVRPDIGTLATDLFRRGQPIESIRGDLVRRGFNEADADKIVNVLKPIPQAGDLIHMAVREAWDDGVSARYGYDSDFPAPFAEWMGKQGYDPEWARRYWRSHWEVPGPTIARDMLHRTDMTEADYGTLLKIADYPPTWRRWMTEVAYEPYTRVDIRRMYQVGVLKTYAELVHAYNDIGYDNEKASKLADFTVLEYGETEKEATKAEVLDAYKLGRLSDAEARAYLAEMGYPDWLIDAFIARVDLSRVNALVAQRIAHAKTLYVNGQMTKAGVSIELNKIPLSSAEIDMYLESWEIDRVAKIARPSKTDLRKFFVENLLGEGQFRDELKGWQLSDSYIELYVADAKRDLVKGAQAASQAAKVEAQRIKAATEKTSYDEQVANIAVAIAERNLIIADLKASASPDMTLVELDTLGKQVVACQIQIKMLQLQKAQVWADYLSAKGEGIVVGGPAPIGGGGIPPVTKGG